MTRILVLSDTHLSKLDELPSSIKESLDDVDFVVHAGDFDTYSFYKELKIAVELKGVAGNSDDLPVKRELPEIRTFEADFVRFGVTHRPLFDDLSDLVYRAMELEVDVMIFGHIHRPVLRKIGGIVLICPGSPTYPRFSPASYLEMNVKNRIVDIDLRGVDGESIFYDRFELEG
jgi:putative phosphoesterase